MSQVSVKFMLDTFAPGFLEGLNERHVELGMAMYDSGRAEGLRFAIESYWFPDDETLPLVVEFLESGERADAFISLGQSCCSRCKRRCRRNLDGWNVTVESGVVVGYLCPDCQTPDENAEAVVNEATVDYSRVAPLRFGDES